MIHDCEAVASKTGLEEIRDEHLFAYLAAIAGAEAVVSEKYDAAVWSELHDGVHIAAGSDRNRLINQFISELCIKVEIDFTERFADMQGPYIEHIESNVADFGDPCDFYKRCIQAADEFWTQTVRYESSQAASEAQVGGLASPVEAIPNIEKRLADLESLRRTGALSEIEYRRVRNRILNEI